MYRFEVTALASRIFLNAKTEDGHSIHEMPPLQNFPYWDSPGFIDKRDHESRA